MTLANKPLEELQALRDEGCSVMSAQDQIIRRLRRSTWDSRIVASKHDVARLFDALDDALESYDDPMSCYTSAERGEILAGVIRELLCEGDKA